MHVDEVDVDVVDRDLKDFLRWIEVNFERPMVVA